ncbi:hypothetical protein CPT_Moby_277 [Stenotrophomonas phage Moby]|uniref:DUF1737 domain-containing protein n=1 Tax=Stenotrophomonas phage Moby TaxID=2601680 RepID=A0A5P8PMU8_9CAUD|nr:hypothetical protein HWC58_gp121 [Stenotrophomonas phage Moby]QFR58002.1 hypothetical protein CPT_Moby_277 [Stenotrophomonas phage Moby]
MDNSLSPVEYEVATGESIIDLTRAVNRLLRAGWVCQGGIFIAPGRYFQAMIKQNYFQKN